jgi:hypothetical protein
VVGSWIMSTTTWRCTQSCMIKWNTVLYLKSKETILVAKDITWLHIQIHLGGQHTSIGSTSITGASGVMCNFPRNSFTGLAATTGNQAS